MPYEDVLSVFNAGAVHVINGSGDSLSAFLSQRWHQDSLDVPDVAQDRDLFGRALASGDFNGDGRRDLAIGVPFEDVQSTDEWGSTIDADDAGAVIVIYGSVTGLDASPGSSGRPGAKFFSKSVVGPPSYVPHEEDLYGFTLTAWDFKAV